MPELRVKTPQSSRDKAPLSGGMRLIVGLKMAEGTLWAVLGVGLLMLHSRAADLRVMQWLENWQVDADALLVRRLLGLILQKLGSTDAHHFVLLGLAAFLYAIVTFIEGLGLWKRALWAEYLTIAISISFIPLEILEIVHHPKIGTVLLLISNVVIVCYLVNRLVVQRRENSVRS
jgi:uncharacterized membrane protein (DUF2068 family)